MKDGAARKMASYYMILHVFHFIIEGFCGLHMFLRPLPLAAPAGGWASGLSSHLISALNAQELFQRLDVGQMGSSTHL